MTAWQAQHEQNLAAMRGESLPDNLDTQDVLSRASVVRGIRVNLDFATSEAVTTLCVNDAQFRRARNARLIMSNVLPDAADMKDPQHHPYCIWYPDFATQATYRKLAGAFPAMRYQVGRACAAAGFETLYNDLSLLPDVSIAEEARESGTDGGRAIFGSIMASPFRYAVMNDYTLRINTENPKTPAFLNGDTDVYWRLGERRLLYPQLPPSTWGISPCIEEDLRIDTDKGVQLGERHNLTPDEARLLHQPLPLDLPTMKKALLICMAAHDGNVDRYARLSLPTIMVEGELLCVVRGIYHHTMFARWWAGEIERDSPRVKLLRSAPGFDSIRKAISVRRIMTNDMQEFEEEGWPADAPQPYLIWWPLKPRPETLVQLAHTVPSMKEQAAVACILLDYERAYQRLDVEPDLLLWMAAKKSPNAFYKTDLEQRASSKDMTFSEPSSMDREADCLDHDLEPTTFPRYPGRLPDRVNGRPGSGGLPSSGPYDGVAPDVGDIQLYVWGKPDWLLELAASNEKERRRFSTWDH
ncbi:hypothetical protein EsH8_VII_000066 [Colletotrichum jinshuiense]